MVRNFFRTIVILESEDAAGKIPKYISKLLNRLILFIEAGTCIKSPTEKFILKNFRLGAAELTKLWNKAHPGCQKKPDTFRGQISLLSQYVGKLFGVSPDEMYNAFVNGDARALGHMSDILDFYEVGNTDLAEQYPFVLQGGVLTAGACSDSEYPIGECAAEIQLLKAFDKDSIRQMLADIDMDKLAYVWQCMSQPLVVDVYEKLGDRSRKVKSPLINQRKLELCKAFRAVVPGQFKPAGNNTDTGVLADALTGDATAHAMKKVPGEPGVIPYNLSFNESMAEVLTKRFEDKITIDEAAAYQKLSEAERENRKTKLANLLYVFTEDGFRSQLAHYNPVEICEVLSGNYTARCSGYQFRK